MLNQTVLVGRLTQDLKEELLDEERKAYYITIAVQRNYKNEDGIYETDFIPIELGDNIGNNVCSYCKKGDILGIKGRIESTVEKGSYKVRIVAEKVTFLSSKKDDFE